MSMSLDCKYLSQSKMMSDGSDITGGLLLIPEESVVGLDERVSRSLWNHKPADSLLPRMPCLRLSLGLPTVLVDAVSCRSHS